MKIFEIRKFGLAALVGATMAFAGAANAATFKGTFWDAPAGSLTNINQAIAYAGANTATGTFTSSSISYGTGVAANPDWDITDLDGFLQADAVGGSLGMTDFQESVILLTGFAKFVTGQSYSVTSDDGFRLFVNNSATAFSEFVGLRAPNNTTSATWEGPTGAYAVSLWYFEGNETQAQLISNLAPVPVPAAGFLLVGALGGLALLRRRKA